MNLEYDDDTESGVFKNLSDLHGLRTGDSSNVERALCHCASQSDSQADEAPNLKPNLPSCFLKYLLKAFQTE